MCHLAVCLPAHALESKIFLEINILSSSLINLYIKVIVSCKSLHISQTCHKVKRFFGFLEFKVMWLQLSIVLVQDMCFSYLGILQRCVGSASGSKQSKFEECTRLCNLFESRKWSEYSAALCKELF